MRQWTRKIFGITAVAFGLSLPFATHAAEFPNQPVNWVLGFSAGGASDYLARTVAKGLERALDTQVVVENRPGASGIIAAGLVHEAAPDGYTIVLVSSSYFNNVALGRTFDFDPLDFEHVTRVATIPNIVAVPADSPIDSVQDLIDAAKADPGQLNYASGGVGTGTHIGTELFLSMTETDMTHVPYKGTKPALLDLMAGRVDVMFSGAAPVLPFIQSGQLKALAVTSAKPASVMPDLPPVAETVPGYEAVTWYAVFAPKGTPEDIVAKLNQGFKTALESEQVKQELAKRGFDPAPTSPDKLGEVLETFMNQTREVAERADITLQPSN